MRFIVLSLPRSRTAWLAHWLGVPHEPLAECSSICDLDCEGLVDTTAVMFWRTLVRKWPAAAFVIVKRDPDEVRESLRKIKAPCLVSIALTHLRRAEKELGQALVVDYRDMNARLPEIWRVCKNTPFDQAWTMQCVAQNIQCNPMAMRHRFDPARFKALQEEQWQLLTA
jgi:hypothetical protein